LQLILAPQIALLPVLSDEYEFLVLSSPSVTCLSGKFGLGLESAFSHQVGQFAYMITTGELFLGDMYEIATSRCSRAIYYAPFARPSDRKILATVSVDLTQIKAEFIVDPIYEYIVIPVSFFSFFENRKSIF
jgi:hypothetical protein